jgi:HD-GYP domain-containing protein (c-di-GMP phosphodiesterase class II)
MKTFQRKTAGRIAAVTLVMAACASPLAWQVSRENAEQQVVAFAQEESRRVLAGQGSVRLEGPQAAAQARQAAQLLTGGLFEIAEIYGADGRKLAESVTPAGHALEQRLPRHDTPRTTESSYESLALPGSEWALRVFVPLRETPAAAITGYFEGVRTIPAWQHRQILSDAFIASLMVCLASLVCGAAIYPVVVHLARENEHKAQQVLESHIAMMEALGRAIAKRDSDTGAHNYRVAWLAASVAEALGLRGAAMQSLIAGSFLHDAGKIGIPDAILLKPGRLDDAEMATMRTHVALGEDIVTGAGWLDGAREVVGSHHEKWDGSGYPRGLAGDAIPLPARIFAVADVFDALSSRRPYKEAQPFAQVMATLQDGRGSHFDPTVLDTFSRLAPALYRQLQDLDEAATRALMTGMVQRHFDILV